MKPDTGENVAELRPGLFHAYKILRRAMIRQSFLDE
jgi:hypothetical protein